jgi:hypothetical protein
LSAEGTIVTQGSFSVVQKKLDEFQGEFAVKTLQPPAMVMKSALPMVVRPDINNRNENPTDGDRRTGDFATYKYYFNTAPRISWVIFFGLLAIYVFLQTFSC